MRIILASKVKLARDHTIIKLSSFHSAQITPISHHTWKNQVLILLKMSPENCFVWNRETGGDNTAGGDCTPGGGTTSTSTTVETVTKNQSTSSLLPLCQLTRIEEPTSFGEALDSKFSKQWRDATDIEYASLLENNAWKPVKRPEDRKVIGCKWVFRVKYDGHEKVEWFKEWFVAQGYSQKYGLDYEETFARCSSLFNPHSTCTCHRTRFASPTNGCCYSILERRSTARDFHGATSRLSSTWKKDLVSMLNNSLNGLKQSPRCWNQKFTQQQVFWFYRKWCWSLCPSSYEQEEESRDCGCLCWWLDFDYWNTRWNAAHKGISLYHLQDERSRWASLLFRCKFSCGWEDHLFM